ncbi:MAG TPA: hypothetical protein PLR25_25505, partial [Planctomycetaceae bacterium]|nr:hypothetical protein [Planctomycetaceae bacterium]
ASSPSGLTNPDEPDGVAAKAKVHAIGLRATGAKDLKLENLPTQNRSACRLVQQEAKLFISRYATLERHTH